jgi:hypothetical protein
LNGLSTPNLNALFGNQNAAALANLYGSAALANGLYGTAGVGSLLSSPYGGATGYGGYGSYYMDPAYGYLKGAADATTAQGNFMASQQQAIMLKYKSDAERLANRRKAFDELIYERDNAPSAEDEKRQFERRQLSRSLHRPSQTEIWSGKALNDILADLAQRLKTNDAGSLDLPMALDTNALERINLAKNGASIGIFRNAGHLSWPVALADLRFQEARQRLTKQVAGTVRQLMSGNEISPPTYRELLTDLDELHEQLRRTGRGFSAEQYIEANSFLNHLDDALKVLKRPDAVEYVSGKYTLKSKTVQELVHSMAAEGLQFAGALPGDEAAYSALYQALAAYHAATSPQTAAR